MTRSSASRRASDHACVVPQRSWHRSRASDAPRPVGTGRSAVRRAQPTCRTTATGIGGPQLRRPRAELRRVPASPAADARAAPPGPPPARRPVRCLARRRSRARGPPCRAPMRLHPPRGAAQPDRQPGPRQWGALPDRPEASRPIDSRSGASTVRWAPSELPFEPRETPAGPPPRPSTPHPGRPHPHQLRRSPLHDAWTPLNSPHARRTMDDAAPAAIRGAAPDPPPPTDQGDQ